MATSPPFQLEDQTDEDFFDRLVDDDDDFKVTAPAAASPVDGNDSDDAKAFASLSIGETASESEAKVETSGESIGATVVEDVKLEDNLEENHSPVVLSDSVAFGSANESNDLAIESKASTSDLQICKYNGIGSPGSGVKEVQWTAFDSAFGQDDSDFFSALGGGASDPTASTEDSAGIGSESKKIQSGIEENGNYYVQSQVSQSNEVGNLNNYVQSQVSQSYGFDSSNNYVQYQESQNNEVVSEVQNVGLQDQNSSDYWDNLYPGWKYDQSTGQWYQVDSYNVNGDVQGGVDSHNAGQSAVSTENSQVSYLQQTAQSAVGTVTDSATIESVTTWNQVSDERAGKAADSVSNQVPQGNLEYQSHLVFDPQYPGWCYDTIAQEWKPYEAPASVESAVQAYDQVGQNGITSTGTSFQNVGQTAFGDYGKVENNSYQGFGSENHDYNWSGSPNNYSQQSANMWQRDPAAKTESPTDFSRNQQVESNYNSNILTNAHLSQQTTYDSNGVVPFHEKETHSHSSYATVSPSFNPSFNFSHQIDQPSIQQNKQMHVSDNFYGSQSSVKFSQQPFQTGHQLSYAPKAGSQTSGRPPHAVVAFGFGGKLIVMKDNSSHSTSSYGSQGNVAGSISVHNLMEVIYVQRDSGNSGLEALDHFSSLSRQSFPGPLVGGYVGNKEVNKWLDERIRSCESSDMEYREGETLKLLLSLLKIACQFYGKLRSPFGNETALKDSDAPESAIAQLFASAKNNDGRFTDHGALISCLRKLPSEGHMQATAREVQNLLVSGRKKEALQCASEGHLWGPALVLAAQLGDQFYVDTVKQMALHQLVPGSPLRTLCLLIAGQPADVFSADSSGSSVTGSVSMNQHPAQFGANGMLDDWKENLAVIAANRTKDDNLVLVHLGDCLWKDRNDIIAAHICYLVAESNFEPYSDSARLCLIGANHWKCPRTYASPAAIQRTELYEYSMVLGNPQYTLQPFQPYKLLYAYMLAEVGKVTESMKYCQAVIKSLKTSRAPEVDSLRQLASSLEERIRTYQQGGFSTNLVPGKLVGKLRNLLDSTAQRVVGGLPPPAPSISQGSNQFNEHYYQTTGPRVSNSQSTMSMSSLVSSSAVEPVSEWMGDSRMAMQTRSVSEPDFGRTPKQGQVDSSKEATSTSEQPKVSRFGRFNFGSQLLQKTVGLVLKPRQDKQAKLGEQNKFYYDEKLKRWVEEGVEPPAAEATPPPPPTTAVFQNGSSDYNIQSALKSENPPTYGSPEFSGQKTQEQSSGFPPIPPTSNQFSSCGRMGVRSRYVDTFNKGGSTPTNLFQSPSAPSIKPAATGAAAAAKFFVPTAAPSSEQQPQNNMTNPEQPATAINNENPSLPSSSDDTFPSLAPPPVTMQRFPSMGNISNKDALLNGNFSSNGRRTASWSGGISNAYSPPQKTDAKSQAQAPSFMPTGAYQMHMSMNSGNSSEDLQEVEL